MFEPASLFFFHFTCLGYLMSFQSTCLNFPPSCLRKNSFTTEKVSQQIHKPPFPQLTHMETWIYTMLVCTNMHDVAGKTKKHSLASLPHTQEDTYIHTTEARASASKN